MTHIATIDAKDAMHAAENAIQKISAHEELCSERYGNINRQLGETKDAISAANADHKASVEKIYLALDNLKGAANKGVGIDIALRYMCMLIGAGGVMWGILK